MKSKKAVLYTDGASSGNPGASGIGVVLDCEGRTHEISEYIGFATNNVAEYTALIRGLEKAKALGVQEIKACLDSELLVKQLTGQYKVKNERLKELHKKALRLLSSFKTFSVRHIPRDKNKKADSLAKKAAASQKQTLFTI